ncbi:MAG: hypothetical protein IJ449_10500 [Clostridia bacterium]|nr:hypothetical protein [Clostridia bacterium]
MTEYPSPTKEVLHEQKERILARIYDHHLRRWGGSEGNVFFISDTYPGVWTEHLYDGVSWADYMPDEHDVSKNHIRLFLSKQTAAGQIPCYIWANEVGYGQTQECVSVGSVCLEAIAQNPDDGAFLTECYDAVSRWVGWLYDKRMTMKTGLIEMFCGYDTGHDNSARLAWDGFKHHGNHTVNGVRQDADVPPTDSDVLPMLAPDMNACFYGNHMALAKMAELLGKPGEAADWREKGGAVRRRMFELLWDENDQFFYDVDKHGEMRKIRSISITNVISEGVMEPTLANKVFDRYLHNENEFWTPYPFPAVSSADPHWVQNLPGNSWGFYSQGLTALRSMRWMPALGRTAEMEELMRRWVSAWSHSETTQFGQELHPLTGKPSQCSQWYSSCMLYFLHSIRRLYGV